MFAYDNCMIIENELFIQMYVLYYIAIKDLNALNRMLTVYFALRIDWYINRCNTPKYTLVVFDMFRVFCKPNLTVS